MVPNDPLPCAAAPDAVPRRRIRWKHAAAARLIPRLNLATHGRRRPIRAFRRDPADSELFEPGQPLREIVVLVDAALLDDLASQPTQRVAEVNPRVLLSRLIDEPLVRLYRYADDGPPAAVEAIHEAFDVTVYQGWAVLADRDPDDQIWQVTFPTETGFSVARVAGNAADVAAADASSEAYRELGDEVARTRRRADTLAAMVAEQAVKADLFITDRAYLHDHGRAIARGVTICHPEDALPLLSLYLRRQGRFLIDRNFSLNRGGFYWVAARELLPAAWRWFTACVQHASGSGDDGLMLLGGSLLQRVGRAIEARDAIHVALNQTQNNDLRDDALANLDVVLILLMAAVDVSARVAHRTLGMAPGEEYRAAWQNRRPGGWFESIERSEPALAAITANGTAGLDTLTILRLLRNSVHGAALQGIAFSPHRGSQESLVALPRSEEADVLAAMERLGGRAAWGVRPVVPGRTHIDPGLLVDRLLVNVIELLNALMAATPVERLPHVALSPTDMSPPDSTGLDQTDPFAPWIRQSIRLQLAL